QRRGVLIEEYRNARLEAPHYRRRGVRVVVELARQIGQRAGIRAHHSVELPFLFHNVPDERRYRVGNLVDRVVRRHEGLRIALLYAHLEWHQVIFAEIPLVEVGRGTGPAIFVAVGQEVLHGGGGEQVLRVVALQPLDITHRHFSDEV